MTLATRDDAIDLLHEYAELIDQDKLEQWLDLFTEDATYNVVPRENHDLGLPVSLILCTNKNMIRDRVLSLRKANEYNLHYDRHLISNIRVTVIDQSSVAITANYALMQTTLGGETKLFSVGRYADKARIEDGRLRLTEKLVVVDTFSVPTLLATPL